MVDTWQLNRTAQVMRGEFEPTRTIRQLMEWISTTFDTDVLNIEVDALRKGKPRLCVWVRTAEQQRAFRDSSGNYDPTKQEAVSKRYAQLRKRRWWSRREAPAFVAFCTFEPAELERIIGLVPSELEEIRLRLGDPRVWRILPAGSRIVFFVHTEAEVESLRESDALPRWGEVFVRHVRPRDSFGLLPKLPPRFELDSKERFERDYQNNTYYYLH
ncbi:MAG: hypothetical protein IJG47_15245 [Microbacterium sp.]|nr:hypothetical protein [Microbacterium sp.]